MDEWAVYLFLLTVIASSRDVTTMVQGACARVVTVDPQYGEECDRQGSSKTAMTLLEGNRTCSSLEDVLNLLSVSHNGSKSAEGCTTEIVLKPGEHVVEGTFLISEDALYLSASSVTRVSVCLKTPASIPMEFTYAISFRNSNFVRISGIDFIGDNGVIGFDNVSNVEINNSSFR